MSVLYRVFSLLSLLVIALASLGCASVTAGRDDVELTYESVEDIAGPGLGEDLRALLLRRLGAAQIGADVSQDGRRVRIVVDEDVAPIVDELVTWPGSLLVFEPDPEVTLVPQGEHRLEARDGAFVGKRPDVIRAAETWPIDREHRILAEPLWESARSVDEPLYTTRVVRAKPVGELGEGVLVGWGDRGMLRLRAAPKSAAVAAIADARTRKEPVVARGRVSLGRPTFDGDGLLLSFGDGFEAYARAQKEKQLLTTSKLPRMRRAGAVGLPPNNTLATACLVVPIVLSLGWLLFVRRFDRAHPEPMWLVMATFGLGALAAVPAAALESLATKATPWLDPRLMTFGGQAFALPLAFVVFTVVVGLSEEGSKRLATLFAARRPEFDEPVDGMVYGIVASLGFAAAENARYFAIGRMNAPLVIARCFMSVPAHMFFGSIWGYALGARLVERRTRAWLWLLAAAAAHGLFDALLSTEGAGLLAVILNVSLASVFVVLVRRALRHGVVVPEMLAIKPEDRHLFRVGRPKLFWLSAGALHALAFGIFVLGAWYQIARHRPGAVFVVGSSVMLACLAVAALGVTWTLPLDVAIDDYGVTFAGAARSWRRIRRFSVQGDHIELDCDAGPLLLGPAPAPTIDALAHELTARLGAEGKDREKTLESSA
jgi:protease PrsW